MIFGGNLGDVEETFRCALSLLKEKKIISVIKCSELYRSPSLLKDAQPSYLNMAVFAQTSRSAEYLLEGLKETEQAFGREQGEPWGPRPLDIDIIDYAGKVIDIPKLQIPHKEFENRAFVVFPVAEIFPSYSHPATGKNIQEMLHTFQDAEIERIGALNS